LFRHFVETTMASKSRTSKRLLRFVESGACKYGVGSEYGRELERLAHDVANVEIADRQSRFFKALADETRLRILKLLKSRKMCVCEVMVALGLTQPTASHHLGIMENAGLLKNKKEGKWVLYNIADPKLMENMHKLGVL